MPMTAETVVQYALLQYREDPDFRSFTDSSVAKLRTDNPQINGHPIEQVLALPVARGGVPLATVILRKWEEANDRRPTCSSA